MKEASQPFPEAKHDHRHGLHYFVGALSLAKQQLSGEVSVILVSALVVYGIFAGLFGWLVFGQGAACAGSGNPQSPDA